MKWAQVWSHSTVAACVLACDSQPSTKCVREKKPERNLFIFYCLSPLVEIHWKNELDEWMGAYLKARLAHHFQRVCVSSDLLFRNRRTLDSFRFEKKFSNESKMLICCSHIELELPMNKYACRLCSCRALLCSAVLGARLQCMRRMCSERVLRALC